MKAYSISSDIKRQTDPQDSWFQDKEHILRCHNKSVFFASYAPLRWNCQRTGAEAVSKWENCMVKVARPWVMVRTARE